MENICFEHLCIRAKDLDETIAFYEEMFGFKTDKVDQLERADGITKLALISLGDFVLEVVAPPVPDKDPVPGHFAHLCFRVDDVDESVKKLTEKGAKFIGEPKDMPLFGGIRNINLTGPNGELLELLAK